MLQIIIILLYDLLTTNEIEGLRMRNKDLKCFYFHC